MESYIFRSTGDAIYLEDPTLEKYWNMARGETGTKESGKEHILFVIKKGMLYRKFKEVLKDAVRLQLMVPEKGTRGHRYKLFKKRKGTLGQKFFSARVVDLWNELDDSTVSVDNVTAFKRKLGKLGY